MIDYKICEQAKCKHVWRWSKYVYACDLIQKQCVYNGTLYPNETDEYVPNNCPFKLEHVVKEQ